MSRYALKFSKEGYIKYTSHLDMLRLFKRSFKRVEVKLQYSQGFNPHPKMSFAQPLSLGYSSTSEYLEFDTIESFQPTEIMERLNSVMPEGVTIISCYELPLGGKTMASLTEYGEYVIEIPIGSFLDIEDAGNFNIIKALEKYISREKIIVSKVQRKSGKEIEIDIKPMIKSISGLVVSNNIMLTIKINAGSVSNLSPEMVLTSFCTFAGILYDRAEVSIKRTEIYFNN